MLYLTNEHPNAQGVWVAAEFDTGEIREVFATGEIGRQRGVALLASAYDWDALTAAGEAALEWEADPAIAYEGLKTSDRRIIDTEALKWRQFPMPYMVNLQTTQQHQGAVIAGAVDHVERRPDGHIYARGRFDTGLGGQEAARLVAADIMRGVSVDMAGGQVDVEVLQTKDGAPSDWLEHFIDAEMSGLTQTPFPAFADARVRMRLAQAATDAPADPVAVQPVVAAGGPAKPPPEWFRDPEFDAPTPLTWTEDGRVYGHIATWDSCHIGRQDTCVSPPRSATNYAYFTTGEVQCDDGCRIPVGTLTLGTGHADLGLGVRQTAEHYDHTGTGAADVAIGEDDFGIWTAGAQRPGLTDEQIRVAQASSPSGDWRRVGGNLELVATLMVNVPGFPIARVASGEQMALVAAAAPRVLDPIEQLRVEMFERFDRLFEHLEIADSRFMALESDELDVLELPDVYSIYTERSQAFKYISADDRKAAAKSGAAMPGGRFPIRNAGELAAAIHLYGQAPDKDAVKAHIIKRAKALNLADQIPKDWTNGKAASSAVVPPFEQTREPNGEFGPGSGSKESEAKGPAAEVHQAEGALRAAGISTYAGGGLSDNTMPKDDKAATSRASNAQNWQVKSNEDGSRLMGVSVKGDFSRLVPTGISARVKSRQS